MTLFYDTVDAGKRWDDVKRAMILAQLTYRIMPYKHALDIGCASGEVTKEIAKIADKVYAIDNSKEEIDAAEANPELKHINFRQRSVYNLVTSHHLKRYDIIFYLGLHHKLLDFQKNIILTKLYKTKAVIIQRSSIKTTEEFVFFATQFNRPISFYPANEGQGVISIVSPPIQ